MIVSNSKQKCLVISRNGMLIAVCGLVLKPQFNLRVLSHIGLSKSVLKSSPAVRIVVLDFELQDKAATNLQILRRLAQPDCQIHLFIFASHRIQLEVAKEALKAVAVGDRIAIGTGVTKYLRAFRFLRRAKKNCGQIYRQIEPSPELPS